MSPHSFIIHFPIALLLLGGVVELTGVAMGDRALRYRAGQLVIAGGVAAFLAFLTGEGAKIVALNVPSISVERIAAHEQWGSVGAWALLGIAIARAMFRNRFEGGMGWVNVLLAVGAAVLSIFITLSGTLVRHGM